MKNKKENLFIMGINLSLKIMMPSIASIFTKKRVKMLSKNLMALFVLLFTIFDSISIYGLGFMSLSKQYSTFGITGLNEAVELLGYDILEVRTDLERMAINARVALKDVPKHVEITDPPGIVYDYFKITTNLESENVKSASINFRVSKSWIDDNEIATIKMHRYNGDWKELKTEKEKEDNNYFYYTAETRELSFFVITGEKKAEVFTPPTTTPTPTVLPTTSPVPSAIPTATPVPTAIHAPPAIMSRIELLIIAVIVASAMIVLVALLRGRKKK